MWRPIWSCFRWSLPCYELLLVVRCALTAPFHPYLCPKAIGGLLSAALVVGLRPPGVTWHPALWSPDFPPLCQSPEGRQRQSPKGPQRQSPEGHQQSSDYPVNSEGGLYRDWWGVSSEITDMMKQTLQMAFFYPPQATL